MNFTKTILEHTVVNLHTSVPLVLRNHFMFVGRLFNHKIFGLSLLTLFLLMIASQSGFAQLRPMMNRMNNIGGMRGGNRAGGSDSLSFEKRNFADDSVDVRYRYLDTAKYNPFDSSISDYFRRVALKPEFIQVGHNSNAARSLLFSPLRPPGWDAGFHALDPYAFTIADTRFMNTTKPYTELGYTVGSKAEQQISILHTQNATPEWNFVLQYRLLNAPGTFNSQNTNHNNLRFNTDYTSKTKRYHAYLILMSNALQSSENGGIEDPELLADPNPAYSDRFNIPTNLARTTYSSRNFFSVKLLTGNRYVEKSLLLRQQYDFGKKDSIVTDSTVVKLFYPRLRLEHTLQSSGYDYRFLDVQAGGAKSYYTDHYGMLSLPDTVDYRHTASVLKNDFSIIQYPDAKNLLQFFKAGVSLINHTISPDSVRDVFSNLLVHGEYRNFTRNKKWDMLLYGEFYTAGRNIGNYNTIARLQRSLGQKVGMLELGFQNISRSPSYLYTRKTAFPININSGLKNENVTSIYGSLYVTPIKARLSVDYFLTSNYTYLIGFNTVAQYSTVFNFLRAGISKEFRFGKRFKWYVDLALQTPAGNAPIHLPWLYARNRLAYEGKPFRNLLLATGLDMRYYSAYYADGYSPLLGQFFYQSSEKISIRPDLSYYFNFRIRSFTSYLRLENLNTATGQYGFGFKANNLAAPRYPNPGMVLRIGIFWNFVN